MSRRAALVAAGAATVAAGAITAARRAEGGWGTTGSLFDAGDRLVPRGDAVTVTTNDGAELAVTVAGPETGAVVVLAHGFSNGREVWAPVAHRLVRAGHRVVLYDHRGHASSTSGSQGHTLDRLADDLRAIVEHLDLRGVTLAGHSMGGMTIQHFAVRHPDVIRDRVQAVVLVATAAHGLGRSARADRIAATVVGGAALERFVRSRAGHSFFRNVFGADVRRADLALSRDLFLATAPSVRSACVTSMLAMDLREANAAIDARVTVIVGERDTLLPVRLAEAVAASIPGATLVRLPDVGHMLPLEAPVQVADAIAEATADAAPIGRSAGSVA